jgi:hypothetical protein
VDLIRRLCFQNPSNAIDPASGQLLFQFVRQAFREFFQSIRSAAFPAAPENPASGANKSQIAFAFGTFQRDFSFFESQQKGSLFIVALAMLTYKVF